MDQGHYIILKSFYQDKEKINPGYLDRFLNNRPEADGCMVLTPLRVQADIKQATGGIVLEIGEIFTISNYIYREKSVNNPVDK
jgi:hypothetical protein